MIRSSRFRPAAWLFVASCLAATAPAGAEPRPLYRAGLATPVTTTTIVRDLRWACVGDMCSAPRTATSPDANVCAAIARRLGRLTSFAVGDRSFDPAQLERCNAAAPGAVVAD